MNALIELVLLSGQAHLLAIEAGQVASLRRLQPTEDTVYWRLADMLPGAQDAGAAQFLLELKHPEQPILLGLAHEPTQVTLTAAAFWPLPSALEQAKQVACIKALAWHADTVVTVLDAQGVSLPRP